MVAVDSVTSLKKPVIDNPCLLVIPCYIHSIPLVFFCFIAIIHLYIIPHMSFGTCICYSHSADEHTGNVELIAQNFEGLGIALAYICSLSVEKRGRSMRFRRFAVLCFVVVVYRMLADVIVNIFECVVSGIARRDCRYRVVYAV